MRTAEIILTTTPVRIEAEPPGAVHEFIDLLTVIIGHAALLGATLPESDDRRHDVAAIIAAAERATRLTRHLTTS